MYPNGHQLRLAREATRLTLGDVSMAVVASERAILREEEKELFAKSELHKKLTKFYESMDVEFGHNGHIRMKAVRRGYPTRRQISAARIMVDLTVEEVGWAIKGDPQAIMRLELSGRYSDEDLMARLAAFYEGIGVLFNRQNYNYLLP